MDSFKRPTIFGKQIEGTYSVKYLEVHLDSKLMWKDYKEHKKKLISTLWADTTRGKLAVHSDCQAHVNL